MFQDLRTVFRGTVVAQALGLLILPVLTRIYTPSDFGHYSFYQAAVLLISVLACLRYDQAILSAASDQESIQLFRLSVGTAAVAAAVALALVVIARAWGLLGEETTGYSAYFYPLVTFLSGTALASTALLTRLGLFRIGADGKIAQAGLAGGTSIAIGAIAPSAAGLIWGDLAGKGAFSLLAVWKLSRGTNRRIEQPVSWRALAIRYSQFPRYSVIGGLLNNGGTFLVPAAMLAIYGSAAAGQFGLMDRSIGLPLGLVVISLSQVFSSQFGRLLRDQPDAARPYFRRLVMTTSLSALLPALAGALLAPLLFPMVFGAQWYQAGEFARIMAIGYFTSAVSGPVSSALVVMQRLRWQLTWEAARLALIVGVWSTAYLLKVSPSEGLLGYAVATIIINFGYVWIVDRELAASARAFDCPQPLARRKA